MLNQLGLPAYFCYCIFPIIINYSKKIIPNLWYNHYSISSYLPDSRYGRRPTILLMVFLEVPLAIASSFAKSYWTYIALRVAGGLFFPALYQLPFILALELMPPGHRNQTGLYCRSNF